MKPMSEMRTRRSSSVRLDTYHHMIEKFVLQSQDSVTGLLPAGHDNYHAWIRDNVYSITSVWALALAYRKIGTGREEDRVKTYELEQATVKCMRGLLTSMIRQRDRVERFQETHAPSDSIHAKFSSLNGLSVVGDNEWGHLQIDAISLYLLTLAQMTASGLQIIYTLDEVNFIQNLVFFIESAYCIPDFGIWERGDKTNTGKVELNASSIGMAKAALEALNGLDLFGSKGSGNSTIVVMEDEIHKCRAVLESMLPRESLSKETDAALLTVIGFPAFAIENTDVMENTFNEVITKLSGKYGCKRFLRDGYGNPREDPRRLHYESWELQLFENIECHWPLFFCYLVITYCFREDYENARRCMDALEEVMVYSSEEGMHCVPELYSVTMDTLLAEQSAPGSQIRHPTGRMPFMWAQSLYVIGSLLQHQHIAPGELDPLNRRLSHEKRPEVVVQVVVLAKTKAIKELLESYDFHVSTVEEVTSIEVHSANILSQLFTYLGRNKKLGLSGRKTRDIGVLATSHLYKIQDKLFAFTPQKFDSSRNYMDCDTSLMMTTLEYGLNYLATCWRKAGRPLMTLILDDHYLDDGKLHPAMLKTLKKFRSGYIDGTRVSLGKFEQFLVTSCVTNLSFLNCTEVGLFRKLKPSVERFLALSMGTTSRNVSSWLNQIRSSSPEPRAKGLNPMRGAIKRSRSLKMTESYQNLLADERARIMSRQESVEDSLVLTDLKIKARLVTESQYATHDLDDLVQMLAAAKSLDEQGDILHYLVNCYGLHYEIKYQGPERTEEKIEIKDLLLSLYEQACSQKNWGIVRHAAGYLGKKVDDLSKSVTHLLVRQKQVTVGMPPNGEVTISGGKLTSNELRKFIHAAYNEDQSMAMLSQELLIYLAMFITTEPELFHGMLRLRVGLIIQVMASELARSLKMSDGDASENLINLSPFEMRNLLHHIMSGREFAIHAVASGYSIVCDESKVSKKYIQKVRRCSREEIIFKEASKSLSQGSSDFKMTIGSDDETSPKESNSVEETADQDSDDSDEFEPRGSWVRRRRLDGALNRVPVGFYANIHSVLEKCQGGLQMQTNNKLDFSLTQEMTSNEMKFALQVEWALNTIPQPEFRQLMVEALEILALIVQHKIVTSFWNTLNVESIVRMANRIFLKDQYRVEGDSTLCCATNENGDVENFDLKCAGTMGICKHFYDSAPSGTYGTMTYLVRACCFVLEEIPDNGDIECAIS